MSGPDITRNFRVEEIGTATVLHFSGRTFMAAQVEELLTMMTKVGNVASNRRIILDFTSCDYLSSEGLGTIVGWWKRDPANFRIVLSDAPDSFVSELFEMTGMRRVLGGGISRSLEEALAR